jgi:DUF1680 family protein
MVTRRTILQALPPSLQPYLAGAALSASRPPLRRIPSNRVQVAGLIGDRISFTWRANVLALDIDGDFLNPFVTKQQDGRFVGVGMLTDAVTHFAFHTGDRQLLGLRQHLIETIARVQENDGYVGLNPPARRIREPWDIHEMSYLVYGLTSDFQLFGDEHSLRIARKIADYLVNRLSGQMPGAVNDSRLHLALVMLGFDRAMLHLYQACGEVRYLNVLTHDCKIQDWDLGIIQGRGDHVYGHAYAYLCRCLAQLELYQLTVTESLFSQTEKALDFLRAGHGMVITGMSGKKECWHSDQSGDGDLIETCSAAYLIRWLDQLFRMRMDPLYLDIIERAVFNTLFAAQSPDGRRLRYYTPFEGARQYYERDTYCCPNNYRRILAELPQMLYYCSDSALWLGLYCQSAATVQMSRQPVQIRQETDYPSSGKVVIRVDPEKESEFSIKLRKPRWCEQAALTVNGKSLRTAGAGFTDVRRRWKRGDVIEFDMAMPSRFIRGVETQQGRVAVMRGPSVYCFNPARNPGVQAANVKDIVLDERACRLVTDDGFRPNGTACKLSAWSNRRAMAGGPDLQLTLTEFPDPGGTAVYFLARQNARTAGDELLS